MEEGQVTVFVVLRDVSSGGLAQEPPREGVLTVHTPRMQVVTFSFIGNQTERVITEIDAICHTLRGKPQGGGRVVHLSQCREEQQGEIESACDRGKKILADEEPPVGQQEQVTVGQLQVHDGDPHTARYTRFIDQAT